MKQDLKDWEIRQYYEREDIQDKILEVGKFREVVPSYGDHYGHRPDTVNFQGDLEGFVESGMVELHGSVERWRNPLLIDKADSNDSIRKGWDLVMDIDCDQSL